MIWSFTARPTADLFIKNIAQDFLSVCKLRNRILKGKEKIIGNKLFGKLKKLLLFKRCVERDSFVFICFETTERAI